MNSQSVYYIIKPIWERERERHADDDHDNDNDKRRDDWTISSTFLTSHEIRIHMCMWRPLMKRQRVHYIIKPIWERERHADDDHDNDNDKRRDGWTISSTFVSRVWRRTNTYSYVYITTINEQTKSVLHNHKANLRDREREREMMMMMMIERTPK